MSVKVKKDRTVLHLAVVMAIILISFLLPEYKQLTQTGIRVIGVFIAAVYGWSASGLVWPSLIAIVVLPFTGVTTIDAIIAGGLGNSVMWLLMLVLIFSELINSSGLSNFIANWFISRKILKGRPWLFTGFFLFTCIVLSVATNIFLGIFIMWGILEGICQTAGYKKHDKYPTLIMIGILVFLLIGAAVMPYRDIPLILLGSYSSMSGESVEMFTYVSFSIPIAIVALLSYVFIMKFVFRADISPLKKVLDEGLVKTENLVLTKRQKYILVYLICFILLMFLPSFIPDEIFLNKILKTLGNGGILTFLMILMCFTKVDGEKLFDFTKFAKEGIMWEVILITIVIMPMGGFITSDSTGILPFILSILNPIFGGTHYIVFFFAIFFIAIILTNFLTNVVVGFVLIPVIFGVATSIGVSAVPLVFMVTMAVHLAILTPAACPYAAITLSNKDWMSAKDMYKYGGISLLIMSIILAAFGYLWTALVI